MDWWSFGNELLTLLIRYLLPPLHLTPRDCFSTVSAAAQLSSGNPADPIAVNTLFSFSDIDFWGL
jgi:hypothetical protein